MILEPGRQGHIGFHYLPLSDEMIAGIVNTTPIQNGFDLTFDFGSPDDFFKLATA